MGGLKGRDMPGTTVPRVVSAGHHTALSRVWRRHPCTRPPVDPKCATHQSLCARAATNHTPTSRWHNQRAVANATMAHRRLHAHHACSHARYPTLAHRCDGNQRTRTKQLAGAVLAAATTAATKALSTTMAHTHTHSSCVCVCMRARQASTVLDMAALAAAAMLILRRVLGVAAGARNTHGHTCATLSRWRRHCPAPRVSGGAMPTAAGGGVR